MTSVFLLMGMCYLLQSRPQATVKNSPVTKIKAIFPQLAKSSEADLVLPAPGHSRHAELPRAEQGVN